MIPLGTGHMAIDIGRRQFISALGGAAVAWPLAARAQPTVPVIGLLSGNSVDDPAMTALRKGLAETGFFEGKNVAILSRSSDGQYERLPALAADLAHQNVRVIVAVLATAAAHAAKAATSTVPIVFVNGSDPVKQGLVDSFNRPGGNVTGITFLTNTLGAKRMEVLHELMPAARTIGFLANPENSNSKVEAKDTLEAAGAFGLRLHTEQANSERAIDAAFETFARLPIDALSVEADAYYVVTQKQIIASAARARIPAIYANRTFVAGGGLMGYGPIREDAFRLGGIYVGKILKGEKPADLPVQQSVKVELTINLKTAKALGLDVPMSLLMRVDEVIE